MTLKSGDTSRDAVVQLTKMGLVFVLDRDTGEPIFPVQRCAGAALGRAGRRNVADATDPPQTPAVGAPGDHRSRSDERHAGGARIRSREFRKYRSGSIYTPPSLRGTITMPGHLGGAEWQGGSFDPRLNVLYVNVNEIPTINRLRPVYGTQNGKTEADLGLQIYQTNCMACHGRIARRPATNPRPPESRSRRPEFKSHHEGAQRHARCSPVP